MAALTPRYWWLRATILMMPPGPLAESDEVLDQIEET
jgi:hypothetical protein